MIQLFKRPLYILQLENYNLKRFLRIMIRQPFSRGAARQKIVWTPKLVSIFILGLLIEIMVAWDMARVFNTPWNAVAFVLWILILSGAFTVMVTMAVIIFWPVDFVAKQVIIRRAQSKIKKLKKLKIIGITGSYGKTTMKEALAAILSVKFKVLKTPDSVNTPVGISRLILSELNPSTSSGPAAEVFIVEMGAYRRGDIKALCKIARPDVAVLTGINEAHLERFGSMENTIKTKFEIVQNAAPDALIVLNNDDKLVRENYRFFIGARGIKFYKATEQDLDHPPVSVLGEYIWGVINGCVIIARQLGLADEEIRRGIAEIKPVPHRLQLVRDSGGITVIDDSYNGNPDGAREAIKVLAKYTDKRKIYITPGLVEAGERTAAIHHKIGEQLNAAADLVILIKNSATPYIAEKLQKDKIMWFESAAAAHNALGKILKPGDVILFQNDWPDNYL